MNKTIFITLLLLSSILFGGQANANLDNDNDLVGWWKFDGQAGDSGSLFRDWSGNNNNAICAGENCPSLADGKLDKALHFDGVNDYLEIANSPSLENITESSFTWSAWYKPDVLPPPTLEHNQHAVVCKLGYHTVIAYGNDSKFSFVARNQDREFLFLDSAQYPSVGQWRHLAVVADDSAKIISLYINGIKEKAITYKGALFDHGQNPIRIGICSNPGNGWDLPANGLIDDVRIYRRALNISEINLLYSITPQFPDISTYIVPAITDKRILPDDVISDNYKSSNMTITAAKGEYEPASFVINSNYDIPNLSIGPTALTGPGIIPAADIDIKSVKVWWQAGYPLLGDTTHKQLVPELLLNDDSLVRVDASDNYLKLSDGREVKISDSAGIPGISNNLVNSKLPAQDSQNFLPINLAAYQNKQFWITVKVPENITAGNYSGKIYLKSNGKILKELDLNVKILPFKLSDSKLEYSIYTMTDLSSGAIDKERNEQEYKADMINMLEHGINNPNIEGKKTNLDKILEIRAQSGLSNKTIYWNYLINWLSEEDIAVIKSQALAAGVKNFYIYLPDEADLTTPENQAQIKRALDNGFNVFDAQYKNQDAVASQLDLLVSAFNPNAELAAKYHSYGHKIFSYANPQMGQEQPETYRRNYGLLLWQKDYDGAMDFAYLWGDISKNQPSSLSSLWNDFDGNMRDHNAVYPTVNGVIDTIQWEGFREGVDDTRYLATLLDRVAYAKTKGINVSAIENWLANLKQTNLATANLGSIRAQMASYIVSLPEPGLLVCVPKTCASLGNYQCGDWSDGCGKIINCGSCAGGKTCNNSGQCVSSGGGGGGGGTIEPQKELPHKLTRAEILTKIAEIKKLLIQLIIQLIAELQKQLAAMKK